MIKIREVNLDDVLQSGHGYGTLLDPGLTMECMEITIGYYTTLSKIIDRKFVHMQKALEKRIDEIEKDQAAALKAAARNPDERQVQKLRKYKALGVAFQQLKDVLSAAQLSVEELEHINDIFGLLPGGIKVYYDYMVKLDAELTGMIEEISGEDYRALYARAQRIIDLVQNGKDALSGADVADVRNPGPSVKEMLEPLKAEMQEMGGHGDGYKVLADGRLVRDR